MPNPSAPSETAPVAAPGAESLPAAPLSLAGTPLQTKLLTMKVLGVGGAGCNALAHLAQSGLTDVACVALNTDAKALERCPVEHKLVLGARITHGLGAGGDPERGRAAAEDDQPALSALCAQADVVFLLAGLGGGTGTGAGPVVAELARKAGALVVGMIVLPFDCEGARRQRQAQLGLRQLKAAADCVICLPNQKLLSLVTDKTSLVAGFSLAHELFAQGVRGLWRLLTQPGLINVDFADVCAVTRGRHSECALAAAEAQGEARPRELLEKLLHHPLLEEGRLLHDAATILVSLVGGPDLSLGDVNTFMEQIRRQGENAHIIMGAAIEESYTGRLAVTVLSAPRAATEDSGSSEEQGQGAEKLPLDPQFVSAAAEGRLPSRHVAPPPVITSDNAAQMLQNLSPRARKKAIKMVQGQLPLEIVSRGRFEKSEPTIRSGQDLDVPTYLRRNLVFN
jgi:cell division protein FtsZ